jgi:hypothetical protein
VIECVKKLRGLKLISPLLRFKEDGSHASNQYNFQGTQKEVPSKKLEDVVKTEQGSRPEPPLPVAEDDHPSRPERPEQSPLNKKYRTIAEVDLMPTEKQKTCTHPPELIVILPDDITICNHCYGLLDENFQLIEEKTAPEIVEAA